MATVSGYQYTPGGTNSWTPNAVAAALHDALVAAGWSVEYLDADAIGSGSEESPAWDKSFSSNSSVGVAVYRMPENGSLSRWYVKPEFGWGSQASRPMVRGITVGTAHTGSGTLTGGNTSAPITLGTSTSTTSGQPWAVCASEDGLFFMSSNFRMLYCERIRDTGTVQDQLVMMAVHTASSPALQLVDADTGLVSTDETAIAYVLSPGGNWNSISANGAVNVPAVGPLTTGPFFLFGVPLQGPPRLWRTIPPASVSDLTPVDITVDGGPKAYVPHTDIGGSTSSFGVVLVATE